MSGSTTYELAIGKAIKFGYPAMLLLMAVFGGLAAVQGGSTNPIAVPFFLIWFGVLGYIAYQVASVPLRIHEHGDGSLTFRSAVRTRRVEINKIESIEPLANAFGVFKLVHKSGSILFLNQFTGFHRLLAKLVEINPGIRLRGC